MSQKIIISFIIAIIASLSLLLSFMILFLSKKDIIYLNRNNSVISDKLEDGTDNKTLPKSDQGKLRYRFFLNKEQESFIKKFITDIKNKNITSDIVAEMYKIKSESVDKLRFYLAGSQHSFIEETNFILIKESKKNKSTLFRLSHTQDPNISNSSTVKDFISTLKLQSKKNVKEYFIRTEVDEYGNYFITDIFTLEEILYLENDIYLKNKQNLNRKKNNEDLNIDKKTDTDTEDISEFSKETLDILNIFLAALLSGDYAGSSKYVDLKKVSSKKIAALIILIDEAGFQLSSKNPIINISHSNKSAWYMINLLSKTNKTKTTDFGIEMKNYKNENRWKIDGINFSKLLISMAESSKAYGVPYVKINDDPQKGERLVLYFEFGKHTLHPRARKQLNIVSTILKNSSNKKLIIEGHADAIGNENYNMNLSVKRSQSVIDNLKTLGIDKSQIEFKAFGELKPAADNYNQDGSDNPEGRRKNRRSEIYLDF